MWNPTSPLPTMTILEFFNLLGSTTKQHKASNNAYRMDFCSETTVHRKDSDYRSVA